MSALYNTFCISVLFLACGLVSPLHAATLRWVHLGTMDAGLVNMAIDGKVVYRSMQPDKSTSWGEIKPGLHTFQIGTEKNPGSSFELEVTNEQKVVVISVSDTNGDVQSRTVLMEPSEGKYFVFNAIHNSMMTLPETDNKAIFGKGFQIPISNEKTKVNFTDSEGLEGELELSSPGDNPKKAFLAILSADQSGKPQISLLRDTDSLFEIGSEIVEIPDELKAELTIISKRRAPKEGAFDPMLINWEQVESKIFWLNLSIGRDPCRLEIGGFPAMRRIPSGRGSGFVKWPSGNWKTDLVVELTDEKVGASSFSLASKSSVGLISSGGGKYPHRLNTVEGSSRGESSKPQIRFMNALPDGILKVTIDTEPEPKSLVIESGKTSEVVRLPKTGFPGASMAIKLDEAKDHFMPKIPVFQNMPPGDWVLIVHLDEESFSKPAQTWIEMDKGIILAPSEVKKDE